MAIYYALGDALVNDDELLEKSALGAATEFSARLAKGQKTARLEFTSGVATRDNLLRSRKTAAGRPIDFVPIGIGKPLTVAIRHVYTGDKAHGFWGDKDMLVASAMKSIAAYDGAPRAINFLVKKARTNRSFRAVDATDKGTTLICYSPALTQSSSVLTVEVMFQSFPEEAFAAVSQAFSSAAGIPVFAPASAYLAAAGFVTRLVGGLGKSLFNGTPALRGTEELTFVTPGSSFAAAGFRLIVADGADPSILTDYKVDAAGMLVRCDDPGTPYDGPEPYVVISLDGRPNDDFKDFAPTAASAALLDKFYNINEGAGSNGLGQLNEALKLFSDMKFRNKAVAIASTLGGIADHDSQEYKLLQTQYDACLRNISNEILRPAEVPARG